MEALRIEILNPKVKTILKQLADLDLITISKTEKPSLELKNLLKKLRLKSEEVPSLDVITKEIEIVKSERYAKKKIRSEVTECRDPKDNFLLNLTIDSKADYLATGDKDLLVLKRIGKARIITLHKLEEILK
ncbi:MAG: putative toxin-antitoxin system toxin component, PIN family [Bacteroidales bacterium]|nr:putative toxin-antitoxin system toxin component, PIN family [Bacteroidales bacterium]